MNRSELHYTTRRATLAVRLRNWAIAALAVAALLAIYAAVQYRDDAITQQSRLQAIQARDGCPVSFHGLPFSFSAYETVNLLRPQHARIACYYSKGTVS